MSDIKFTEEEVSKLNQLKTDYVECTNRLGEIEVQKLLNSQRQAALSQAHSDMIKKFEETQKEEVELPNKITEKYGPGTLDPNTGVFTPSESDTQGESK